MEEDKLSKFFGSYNPQLPDDSLFMHELKRKLEGAEMLKEHLAASRRRSRRAVLAAAVTGFVFGLLSVFLYPVLNGFIVSLADKCSGAARFIVDYRSVFVTAFVCLLTGVLTYTAYDITASVGSRNQKKI